MFARSGDFGDSTIEGFLIRARWLAKPADLTHELQSRGGQFVISRAFAGHAEHFDASTHRVKDDASMCVTEPRRSVDWILQLPAPPL